MRSDSSPPGTGLRTRLLIVGTDAALAVRPSTAVQFAHACLKAGYALAVPATWGDELIAAETLRLLRESPAGNRVMCSCPLVRERLLARGAELAPFLVSLVSPPVATARYLRARIAVPLEVHFVGRCPGGEAPEIDRWIDPDDFLAMLDAEGIDVTTQPQAFDGVLPPDRRRFWSLPGGFPAPEQLWDDGLQRRRLEVENTAELATSVVDHLLADDSSLLDLAPALQCCCAGVVAGIPARTARARVALTEPPRSGSPVVERGLVPLVHPIEEQPSRRVAASVVSGAPASAEPTRRRTAALRAAHEPQRRRHSGATAVKPSPTSVPVSRQSDGRLVPRAYAARRRLTPPGTPAEAPPTPSTNHREPPRIEPAAVEAEADETALLRSSPPLGVPVPVRD